MKIVQDKKLTVYLVFGKKVKDGFAVGLTEPREPDDKWVQKDQSTGNVRKYIGYFSNSLISWQKFLQDRIKIGDKEPDLKQVSEYRIPFIGST